ncbi:MAG: Holliday junction branch migration protein RuvA [Eubacterium sp.]|nr:Holliday junction branch migration protein RuvA [Eubacterium sp.]
MISYIKGILADQSQESIVVDVSGIGWQIFVSGQVLDRLPGIGQPVKIHTWLQVREDAMTLFGFLTKDDLQVFKLLLGVSGIGPKGALAILSVMTADELRFAVLGEDAKTIAKSPGVGLKTARRLILELKDKISFEETFAQTFAQAGETPAQEDLAGIKSEAVMALTALGYSSTEALKVLSGITITPDMEVEALLKQALKNMSML